MPTSIPPIGKPNPAAYDNVIPSNHPKLSYLNSNGAGEFDLFPICEGEFITVGRKKDNTIVLSDPQVSKRHLRIDRDSAGFHITDLASSNGTFLNGKRLQGKGKLSDNDTIKIGDVMFTFRS